MPIPPLPIFHYVDHGLLDKTRYAFTVLRTVNLEVRIELMRSYT